MPISMPAGWRESAAVSRRIVALARLYYGAEGSGDYVPVGSDSISLSEDEYIPIMPNIPSVDYGVDPVTHAAEIGNLRLRLINRQVSDLLADPLLGSGSDTGFENRKCEVRLWTTGINTWNDCLLYYSGIMRHFEHDGSDLVVEVESQDRLAHLDLPRTEVTLSAYPSAPTTALGRYLPICMGSIDYAPGIITDNTVDLWTSTYPVVRFDDTTYAADGPKGYNTVSSSPYAQGPLFAWSGQQFVPARTDTDQRYTSGSTQLADCRIDFDQSAINLLVEIYPSTASATWDGANSARVTDGSSALLSNKSANAPWTRTVNLRIDDLGSYIASKDALVYAFCRIDGATQADSTGTLKLFDSNGNSVTVLNLPAATTSSFNNMTDPPPDSYSDRNLGTYRLTGDAEFYYELRGVKTGSGTYNVSLSAYELGLVLIINEGDHANPQWFANVDGRKDDGSGTYTGTAGSLIESPTDIIHQIAASDVAITDIDTAAFSASRTALSGWKHAFAWSDVISSKELFATLGRQAKSFPYFGPDRDFTIATIADTYSSSNRSINFDIVGEPRFRRSRLDDLITKVVVKYGLNYATGTYENQVSASDSTQQSRYNVTEAQSTVIFEADAIRDPTTAGKLRDYLLRQWKQPHNLFEGSLPIDHIDLDIGDVIEFINVPYKVHGEDITQNQTRNGQTIYKYWWIYRVRRTGTHIQIKALQLHDLS